MPEPSGERVKVDTFRNQNCCVRVPQHVEVYFLLNASLLSNALELLEHILSTMMSTCPGEKHKIHFLPVLTEHRASIILFLFLSKSNHHLRTQLNDSPTFLSLGWGYH